MPNGNFNYPSFDEPVYLSEDGVLGFKCYNVKDFDCRTSVRVLLTGVYEEDTCYNFDDYLSYYSGCMSSLTGSYKVDTSGKNMVNVTRLDLDDKIVSGTFEYNLIQSETGEVIKITEGRFDVGNVIVY